MKHIKNIIAITLLFSNYSFSQGRFNTYQSNLQYIPRSYSELAILPMEMKRRQDINKRSQDNNSESLYNLKKWIIELKSEIYDDYYLELLNKTYDVLDEAQNKNLAVSSSDLRDIEIFIKDKIVNGYIEKGRKLDNVYEEVLNKVEIKDYDNAYQKLNYILDEDPKYSLALFMRGNINLYIKLRFEDAIKDFKELILIKPDPNTYLLRAEAYYRNGDFLNSISDYTFFLSTNPDDTNVLFSRALAKSEQGYKFSAIEDYDLIIKLQSSTTKTNYKLSTVYNNKAYCLVGLGNYNEALPLANKALELDKSEAYIWDTRGELNYKLNKYQECIADMNKAISIEQTNNSFYYRGLAKMKLNKQKEACEDLNKSKNLGSHDAIAEIEKNCK